MSGKRIAAIVLTFLMCITSLPITAEAAAGSKSESYSNLVIFAQFADSSENFMQDSDNVAKIVRNFTDESFPKSLVSYVDAVSYGQMHINSYLPQYDATSKKITPIVLPNNRDYYANQSSDYFAVKDAVTSFLKSYDVSKLNLDQNNDNFIDNVTFVFEGDEGARASVFYPHKSDHAGSNISMNGKSINTVNVLNSDSLIDEYSINSYGVIAHEFMHSLGYPDLYTEDGSATPVGTWDLMASSSNFMQYPLAYLRSSISGWLTMDTVTTASHLTLTPATSSAGNEAYILKSPLSTSEFFVIEYRKQGTKYSNELEVKIPGTGLIIYRINMKAQNLSNHNGLPFGVYVFREGETTINGATASNMSKSFFSQESGRTSFGSTDLDATISDNALVFSDGTNSGIKISNIGSAGDTISCDVSFADYESASIWNTIGDSNAFDSTYSAIASIDTDDNGTPYVLYSTDDGMLKVKKYNRTSWDNVGDGVVSTNACYSGKLVMYQNTPYVLCRRADNRAEIGVSMALYKFQNNQWTEVKTWIPEGENDLIDSIMEKGTDGLYISCLEGTFQDGYTLKLYRCDTSNNIQMVSDDIATGTFANADMAIDGSKIYLSARHYGNTNADNYPVVWKYENGKISKITDDSLAGTSATKIAAASDNVYLLADSSTNGVRVYQYNVTNGWTQISKSGSGVSI